MLHLRSLVILFGAMQAHSFLDRDAERHWVWFEHFCRAAGTTMDAHAILNGLKSYSHLGWSQDGPFTDLNVKGTTLDLADLNGTELYERVRARGANYVSNEQLPVSFLELEKVQPLIKITMLREPAERIESLRRLNLIPSEAWRRDNEYVRRLLGDSSSRQIGRVNKTHLEQAQRALSDFSAVLIFEDFDRSYKLLGCAPLNWRTVDPSFDGHQGIPEGLTNEGNMLRRNTDKLQVDIAFDTELYQFARKLNQEQLENCRRRARDS